MAEGEWLAVGRMSVVSLSTDKFRLREDWQLCVVEDEQEELLLLVEVMDFNANCSSKKSERHYLHNSL